MRIPIFFMLCFCLNGCLESQKTVKNDWQKLNLKGQVKSVKSHCYEALESNGVISKGKMVEYPLTTYVIFDQEGKKTDYLQYDNNDSLISERKYTYDTDGYLLEEHETKYIYHKEKFQKGKVPTEEESILAEDVEDKFYEARTEAKAGESVFYLCDKNGNVIKKSIQGPYSSELWNYKYDKYGNCIEEILFREKDVIDFRNVITYDNDGRRIEFKCFDFENKLIGKTIYTYDNSENSIEEILYTPDEEIETTSSKKYDENGNMILCIPVYSNNSSTYQYVFDETGNWIKNIHFHDNEPFQITEREIEYF